MNILSLAEWDWAGVGYQLSESINKYTEHTSIAVRWREKSRVNFPCQITRPSQKKFDELYKWADVIHIHDDYIRLNRFNKPTIITYHGSKYRSGYRKYNKKARSRKWIQTVATFDLLGLGDNRWFPDARFLPDIGGRSCKEFTVCQAPTSKIKDKEIVIEACKIAGVKLDLIEEVDWIECVYRKARCHLLIDQFKLGYGCNAVEGWLLGLPVICGASDNPYLPKMVAEKNDGVLPFIYCEGNPEELANIIIKLRDNEDYYNKYKKIGYDYAIRYHSPESVSKIAIDFYEYAIRIFGDKTLKDRTRTYTTTTRQGNKQAIEYNPDTQTLVQHLFANHSSEEILAPSGNKYTFDIYNNIQAVYDYDVDFFMSLFVNERVRGKRGFTKQSVFRIVRNK